MWALEDFLRTRRVDIDRKYDYRYSQLIFVFAQVLSANDPPTCARPSRRPFVRRPPQG